MNNDDQFTSVQWDRDEETSKPVTNDDTIEEMDEPGEDNDVSLDKESPKDDSKATDLNGEFNTMNDDDEETNAGDSDNITENLSNRGNEGTYSKPNDGSNEFFEKYFIDANVSDPIRDIDQSSKPYISYFITTKTDNPSIIDLSTQKGKDNITLSVRRRYGDFRNLYHCLTNDFPQVLIPPLPSKLNLKYLTGDTFGQEFVHKRLNSLNRFIKFINNHKVLSQLSVYHLFLSDSNDWLTFSKNLKINNINEVEKEHSFTSNMVNRVVNEDILTETVMNFLTPAKHKKETNKEILEISDKLKKLYENLMKLDKIFSRLNKKNIDLSVDYEVFSNQIGNLSSINEFQSPKNNDSNGFNGDRIEDNFNFFANCLKNYLESWSKSFTFINESFLTSLKDCSKYVISLTNLIELQHNKKIDLEVLQEYLDKSKNELASIGGSNGDVNSGNHRLPPSPIKNSGSGGIVNNTTQLIKDTLSTSANSNIGSSSTEQKKIKLKNKITQLESEIELQTQLVSDLINKIIYEEYPNWDKFNKNELKSSMLGLCDNQIDFYNGLIDNWNETEVKLMKRIDELN